MSNRRNNRRAAGQARRRYGEYVRIPTICVDDIELSFANIFHEAKLAEDAPATVETFVHRVCMYLHILTETVDQRTFATEASNVNRKARAIQSIGGINELPFRSANIEIVDELQNS